MKVVEDLIFELQMILFDGMIKNIRDYIENIKYFFYIFNI